MVFFVFIIFIFSFQNIIKYVMRIETFGGGNKKKKRDMFN